MRQFRILLTFALVTFAWIFFRMPTVGDAVGVINKIMTDVPSAVFTLNRTGTLLTVAALLVVVLKDQIEEWTSFSLFRNRHAVVRWTAYFAVVFSILLFGVLDAGTFIYAGF